MTFLKPLLFITLLIFGNRLSAATLINDVTVISAGNPLHVADVLLDNNGKIKNIATQISDQGHYLINGKGKFLIPGLIDSHVHLGSTGGIRESVAEQNPRVLKQFRRQEASSYLYFGFTSLVDLKQSESFVENWRSQPNAPHISYCKALPLAHGYGMAFLSEKIKFKTPYFVYNRDQIHELKDLVGIEDHDVPSVINKVSQTQASCIKTHFESGFGGLWNWPTPNDELLAEITSLATAAGLVHTHHGNSLAAYRQASNLPIDVMAHGLWHWEEENSSDTLPDSIKQILKRMVKNGTAIQTTSQVLYSELRILDDLFLEDPLLKHSLPKHLITWHQEGNSDWFKKRMSTIIKDNPDVVERFLGHKPTGKKGETTLAGIKRLGQATRYLDNIGATFLMASDSPSSPTYSNPPGLNGFLELKTMHQMGLSLTTIFESATVNNARVFKIAGKGEIKIGKDADLLLLTKNPLETIDAYNSIELVILSGKVILRDSLSAALQ